MHRPLLANVNISHSSGRNLTFTSFGEFYANVSGNASVAWFVAVPEWGGIWDMDPFCNVTMVRQTLNNILQPVCPPVRAAAFMETQVLIPREAPTVRPKF